MAKEVTPEQIEMLDGMVAKARAAAEIIATYDQERVDRLCQAVAASVIDMKVWANLADEAVDETGLGDKVTKRNKRNKLKLILRDCLRQKSVGVIEEIPEKGIVKYAKPVGVIASLVPTTNPCLTPAGQVIYAIKARDVIICSPHPRAKKTTNKCINIIRETLVREGAPADIIQGIEEPSITLTQELMKRCDLVIATGGLSYPATGSTGDGYRFARELGLKVTDIAPSLVPLKTKEDYIPKLQGLSLKNTGLTIKNGKKVLYEDFGEMMFTHFGVTGPMILSASAHIGAKLAKAPNGELSAYLDLKPALTREQLDARILREFEAGPNKQFKNVIGVLFPSSLTPVMLELGGIPAEKKIHDISREERQHFIDLIKAFPFTITGMGEFKEAIITRGGVSVKEINSGTMESKKISGLYFAGEVLDLDAVTGGYNLQIAWSTAYLAAQAIQ